MAKIKNEPPLCAKNAHTLLFDIQHPKSSVQTQGRASLSGDQQDG